MISNINFSFQGYGSKHLKTMEMNKLNILSAQRTSEILSYVCTSLHELLVVDKNLPEKDNAAKLVKSDCKNPRKEKIRPNTIISDELEQKSIENIHEHFLSLMESFKEITIRQISTTAHEEEQEISKQSLMAEKRAAVDKEYDRTNRKVKYQLEIQEKEMTLLHEKLSNLQFTLKSETQSRDEEEKELHRTTEEKIKNKKDQHSLLIKKLEMQRCEQSETLKGLIFANKNDASILRKQCRHSELMDQKRKIDFDVCLEEWREKILIIQNKAQDEEHRLLNLKEHFDKVDKNNGISSEESMSLAKVVEMEEIAQQLLDNAAVKFQKIMRGRRDRISASKLKLKQRKATKKGKKEKKKKKGKK